MKEIGLIAKNNNAKMDNTKNNAQKLFLTIRMKNL